MVEEGFDGVVGIPWSVEEYVVSSFFGRSACAVLRAKIREDVARVIVDGVHLLAHLVADGLTEGIWDGLVEGIVDGAADVFLGVEDDAVCIVDGLDVALLDGRGGGGRMVSGVGPFGPWYRAQRRA